MLRRELLLSVALSLLIFHVSAQAQTARAPASQTQNPHGPIAIPCENCHTLTSWKPIRAVPEFEHNRTSYPLRGMHAKVGCVDCHTKPVFSNVGTQCADCHADIHRRQFGATCEQCHTVLGWNVQVQAIRAHENRFPLVGAHAAVECTACHTGGATGQFQGLSTQCYSCHARDFQGVAAPNHVTAKFSTNCESCHRMNTWLDARFDHSTTGFSLTGAHAGVTCSSCHVNGNYSLTAANATCSSCHMPDFQTANNPNHVQGGFSTNCQTCHTTASWASNNFDHNATGFPLTGAHATVACATCHVNNNFSLTAANALCSACHLPDFQGTTSPNHVQASFPTTCESCHTSTTTWSGATFNHASTGFALTGAHATVACASCHVNNNYGLTAANAQCSACHLPDFQGTTSPNHVQASFPTTCESCHTSTTTWSGATFNHASTGFALTGAHATVACASCHVNNNYSLTAANAACSACHMPDFQTAASPNHVQAAFPTTCQTCHTTTRWDGATFNHATTGFALTGAHVSTPCSSCHVNNNYALTAANAACAACHLPDFQSVASPNHVQANFSTNCQTCHSTTSWSGAAFDHATTGFPLTGAHVSASCASCHVNNNYAFTSANAACAACHMPDFQTAASPNHVQAAFPTTCQTCHTTTRWDGATFNHATTGFALTGAHVSTPCSSCHVNNNYALTAANAACAACHLPDFQSTNNPSHTAAGFPTDCTICHSTTTWNTGTFNHATTGWALTGSHTSVSCSSCHVNNNYNLTSTSCVTCHLPDYNSATTPINHVQLGFPTTCELCHNTAAWNGATFNHNTTGFPLTGRHTSVACASCHVNNNYTSVPTDCYSCHRTVYQTTTDPNHVAAGFPTTCQTCHTTTQWSGATFNHTWFPMNHGKANSVCATCHTNSSDYSIFQCTICHTASKTDNKHNGVRNYVFNSVNCLQCHPQGRN